MYLSRGQKLKLSEICKSNKFIIKITAENNKNTSYDISAFGLDENDKCSDDKYMIFYNQKMSPCRSIILLNSDLRNKESFEINIDKLPPKIKKIVFTITIDGNDTMSELNQGSITLLENDTIKTVYNITGSDFQKEKSIMIGEIYFKTEWRFGAVGSGFNGGLSSLLEHFGIEEEEEKEITTQTILDTTHTNISESINNSNPQEKNKLSSFFKSILTSPFKYGEKKINERKEISERKNREINEYNETKLKENRFKELLIEYLSDGILTDDEMNGLRAFCSQNNLNLENCLNNSQNEIESFLRVMLANIVSDNIVTEEEQSSINSVCKFLNPSLRIRNEIEIIIKRVKEIEKIKSGDIQALENNRIITKISELVWCCEPDAKLLKQTKKGNILYNGEIFVTSERLIFRSQEYPLEILLKNILDIEINSYNLFISGKSNKSNCQFKLNESERLGAYLEQALNKFHRKLDFSGNTKKTRSIPQTVRQEVWIRDQAQCVECSAVDYLEYDHIIPFSKGGSNSSNNVQLLCRKCNLKKRDRI